MNNNTNGTVELVTPVATTYTFVVMTGLGKPGYG